MGLYNIWIRWLFNCELNGARIMLISHRFINLHVLKILLHFPLIQVLLYFCISTIQGFREI
jgi:hypothetical protein